MKNQFILSVALLSTSVTLALDVSNTLFFPRVDGLETPSNFNPEITSNNEAATYSFSMTRDAVKALLQNENLPPIHSSVTNIQHNITHHKDVTPQCQVTHQTQDETFQVTLTDSNWVKKKGFFCRFVRFFSKKACLPKSDDVVIFGEFEHTGINPEDTASIQPLADADCVSSAPNGDGHNIDQLNTCTNDHSPTAGCLSILGSAPLRKMDEVWAVSETLHGVRDFRKILPALVKEWDEDHPVTHTTVKTLSSLVMGALTLTSNQNGNFLFKSSNTIQELVNLLSPDRGNLDLVAAYDVIVDENHAPQETIKKIGAIETSSTKLNNFPEQVKLSHKDILNFEQIVDTTTYETVGTQIFAFCKNPPTNMNFTDFGRFMCETHLNDLLGSFIRRVEYRLRFIDQNGIQRFLTWIREAPAKVCTPNDDRSFSCTVGNDYTGFLEDSSLKLGSFFDDPSYEDGQVTFSLDGFLPRALEGSPPLRTFIRAQASQFELK